MYHKWQELCMRVFQGCAAPPSVTLRRLGAAMGQMRTSCLSLRTADDGLSPSSSSQSHNGAGQRRRTSPTSVVPGATSLSCSREALSCRFPRGAADRWRINSCEAKSWSLAPLWDEQMARIHFISLCLSYNDCGWSYLEKPQTVNRLVDEMWESWHRKGKLPGGGGGKCTFSNC